MYKLILIYTKKIILIIFQKLFVEKLV